MAALYSLDLINLEFYFTTFFIKTQTGNLDEDLWLPQVQKGVTQVYIYGAILDNFT